MQPLFIQQSALQIALALSLIAWRVLETVVDIRTRRRLRAGAQRQDKGSLMVLYVVLVGGILLGTALAFVVPVAAIMGARAFFFWLGIVLINAGVALRFYAITVLGAFFTSAVAVTPEQTVIATGPYRFIRHPSYAGLLITLLGYGFCLTNWLGMLAIIACALIGLSYRIDIEERVLQAQLGQQYQEYMRRTKRLIPFVL